MVQRAASVVLRGVIVIGLLATGGAIKCYICDNTRSKACGTNFKSYQFDAEVCKGEGSKCGKQTQLPTAEGWVGVLRGCYVLGTFHGINESNGCHMWYNEDANFTAEYCFCDRDYCNAAQSTLLALGPSADPCSRLLSLALLLLAFLLPAALTGAAGLSGSWSGSCSGSCSLAKMAQHAFSSRSTSRVRRQPRPHAPVPNGASDACSNMTVGLRASDGSATAARKVREPPARPGRRCERSLELPRHPLCRLDHAPRLSPDDGVPCCTERQPRAVDCSPCAMSGTLDDKVNPSTDQAPAGYASGWK